MTDTESAAGRRSFWSALAVYTERSALVMIALGFSAGLPYFLIFDTLSAWLRASGLSLEVIGFFSLVTLVSTFKFLWAPFVDRPACRCSPDGWASAFVDAGLPGARSSSGCGSWPDAIPRAASARIAVFAVLVGLASATQDIAIDAWRIEVAEVFKQGAMAAAYQWGYRVAIIVAGAVPLLLADVYGWNFSYAVMAALMADRHRAPCSRRRANSATRCVRSRPRVSSRAPGRDAIEWTVRILLLVAGALVLGSGLRCQRRRAWAGARCYGRTRRGDAVLAAWASDARVWIHLAAVLLGFGVIVLAALPLPGARTRPGAYFASALGDPLRDFFSRYRGAGGLILALICLYRIPDFVLNIMNPFYLDLGYSLVDIAEVRKIFGVG